MASFGARIRQIRRAVTMTQRALVERLAEAGYTVGQPLISLIENDHRTPPYHGVMALAKVLEVNPHELLQLANYPAPTPVIHLSTTDVFFRGHNDPEPSAFDQRIFEIEQRGEARYVLYPVESYVTRPSAQIKRQELIGRCSFSFWQQRRAVFEQHLRKGAPAYHLHSMTDLLEPDEGRGVVTNIQIVELLQTLQRDLQTFPSFHLGLMPASLNLSFFLSLGDRDSTGIIAAYPRNWNYRPESYLEGLCVNDRVVVNALFDEFLAIWHDSATITKRDELNRWIEDESERLLKAETDGQGMSMKTVG